jgi:hypothetical protein
MVPVQPMLHLPPDGAFRREGPRGVVARGGRVEPKERADEESVARDGWFGFAVLRPSWRPATKHTVTRRRWPSRLVLHGMDEETGECGYPGAKETDVDVDASAVGCAGGGVSSCCSDVRPWQTGSLGAFCSVRFCTRNLLGAAAPGPLSWPPPPSCAATLPEPPALFDPLSLQLTLLHAVAARSASHGAAAWSVTHGAAAG